MSTFKLLLSDIVSGVVYVMAEYADGNLSKSGNKALWSIAEQALIVIVTRLFSGAEPKFYKEMIKTDGMRKNIIQFAVSAISSVLMRRGKTWSHALNSLGASCLATDLTSMLSDKDYAIFGDK